MSSAGLPTYIPIRDDASCISKNERAFILATASTGSALYRARLDGRKPMERRPVQLQLTRGENLATCTACLGAGTRATATVSADLIVPPQPDRPNEGSVSIAVDISNAASTAYRAAAPMGGGGGGGAGSGGGGPMPDRHQKLTCNHILRTLEKLLRDALDAEALCVVSGAFVWRLNISVTVLDDFGNLMDAAVLCSLAALRHYRKPIVVLDDSSSSSSNANLPTLVPSHQKEPTPLPLHHTPLTMTFGIFPKVTKNGADVAEGKSRKVALLMDPTQREELCQTGSLTIAMNAHAEICLLDFSGGCELDLSFLRKVHQQAAHHIPVVCASLEQELQSADEHALQERLAVLQKHKQPELPPLPENANAPYYQQADAQAVEVDLEADQALAAYEDEVFRKQALDYNLGHVASKVRENEPAPKTPSASSSSSLLRAMLLSVGGNIADDDNQTAQNTATVKKNATETKAAPAKVAPSETTLQGTRTTASPTLTEVQSKQPPVVAKKPAQDSDEEEETTMVLESEFGTVVPTEQKANANDNDDDDVDDLAAAIKTKKKKKGKIK
jgi:exosome complex component RRP45